MDKDLEQRTRAKYKAQLLALDKETLAELILQSDDKIADMTRNPKEGDDNRKYWEGLLDARAVIIQKCIDAFREHEKV